MKNAFTVVIGILVISAVLISYTMHDSNKTVTDPNAKLVYIDVTCMDSNGNVDTFKAQVPELEGFSAEETALIYKKMAASKCNETRRDFLAWQ